MKHSDIDMKVWNTVLLLSLYFFPLFYFLLWQCKFYSTFFQSSMCSLKLSKNCVFWFLMLAECSAFKQLVGALQLAAGSTIPRAL